MPSYFRANLFYIKFASFINLFRLIKPTYTSLIIAYGATLNLPLRYQCNVGICENLKSFPEGASPRVNYSFMISFETLKKICVRFIDSYTRAVIVTNGTRVI